MTKIRETVEIDAASVLITLEKLASEQDRVDERIGLGIVQQWLKIPDSFPTDFKKAAAQIYEYFIEHQGEDGWNQFDRQKVEKGYKILQSEGCAVAYGPLTEK
ncbi:MAG: hypothetical protein CMH64_04300 [Nanoarchaeota archaeon]|nr:hypothetical protein [Nanoarchaeota archaeon]|tara:strand:+ start:308 stop:616 length:309 start_codon:yes stop_codon:yes gene_type:complete